MFRAFFYIDIFEILSPICSCSQLTAFAYKDYVSFGYVDMGLTETSQVVQRFNINTYAPTMLLFKENSEKPADVIQVKPSSSLHWWFYSF